LRFVHNQLPGALARRLTALWHEAQHVRELALVTGSDTEIWRRAVELGAAIVTCDTDFEQPRLTGLPRPPVVLLRFGNLRRRELLARVEVELPDLLSRLEAGERVVAVD
jgi:predicted nuclease of predicted toxin-antitoxin system